MGGDGFSVVTIRTWAKASFCWGKAEQETEWGWQLSKQRKEGVTLIIKNHRNCHHLCQDLEPSLGLGASLTWSHLVLSRSQRLCLVFLFTDKETETQRPTWPTRSLGKWHSPGSDLYQKVVQTQGRHCKGLKEGGCRRSSITKGEMIRLEDREQGSLGSSKTW